MPQEPSDPPPPLWDKKTLEKLKVLKNTENVGEALDKMFPETKKKKTSS